ncbi:MAG: metallophosphoesterase [Myxococcales bacterium]|nr:metallophosphoesterase [Myxococcales bacterium]
MARRAGLPGSRPRCFRYRVPVARVVQLPDRGKLLVATDLQGNVRDFRRVAELYEAAVAASPEGALLVVTGDLVHGPEIPASMWPDYLGSYYHADSATLLGEARELADRHPGRVIYLLGNHEHAHVGGPVVSKFFPDEAGRLDAILGPERSGAIRAWFAEWPLVAYARRAGLCMLHGAPSAGITRASDLDLARLDTHDDFEQPVDEILAGILWARTTSTARARAFLQAIDPELSVAVYGHDVVREGYTIDREPLLCISTSFGCFDGDKVYLEWDLAERAESAYQLAARGLRPLYPTATAVYRA